MLSLLTGVSGATLGEVKICAAVPASRRALLNIRGSLIFQDITLPRRLPETVSGAQRYRGPDDAGGPVAGNHARMRPERRKGRVRDLVRDRALSRLLGAFAARFGLCPVPRLVLKMRYAKNRSCFNSKRFFDLPAIPVCKIALGSSQKQFCAKFCHVRCRVRRKSGGCAL